MDKEVATAIAGHLQEANAELSRALELFSAHGEPHEFEKAKKGIARALVDIAMYAASIVYVQYPELIPESLRGIDWKRYGDGAL
jgi:hypothetical protein